jgi:type I restriction enzyme S subunit
MVRDGYKMTEVGVIPLDWEVVEIGDIFQFLTTGSNSRAQLSDYADTKYIHYGDIHTKHGDRILDFERDSCTSIDSSLVSRLPKLQDGDLVISDASEDFEGIGLSVELRNVNSWSVVGGLHTIVLRDQNQRFINGYKAYLTSIKEVKSQMIQLSTGTTVYGISKSKIATIKIPLPPQG